MTTVTHYPNGQLKRIEVSNESGQLHNPNGPAYQAWYANGQERWREHWIDGQRHNPNGPTYQTWYENGQEGWREYWLEGKEITEEQFNARKSKEA